MVADSQSNKPLAGASVYIYEAAPRVGVSVYCPGCYLDCTKRAKTNNNGRFAIENVDKSLLFSVLVLKQGYKTVLLRRVDTRKGAARFVLRPLSQAELAKPAVVGRVVDDSGTPIVGATLRLDGVGKTGVRNGEINSFSS